MVFQIRPAVVRGKSGFIVLRKRFLLADLYLTGYEDKATDWDLRALDSDYVRYGLYEVKLFKTVKQARDKTCELYGTESTLIDYLG